MQELPPELIRAVQRKSPAEIAREWDAIAAHRASHIATGKDLSHTYVLVPTVLELAQACDRSRILDVGCGGGFLTERLAGLGASVLGIDPSPRNIEVAQARLAGVANLVLANVDAKDLARQGEIGEFSLLTANMVLMTEIALADLLQALGALTRVGGHFIFTVTHPCFWPTYWGYASADWFHYTQEVVIEAPFRISLDPSPRFVTTHVHRPIEQYMRGLGEAGFKVEELREPMPSKEVEAKYPTPWKFPRFLAGRCVRAT